MAKKDNTDSLRSRTEKRYTALNNERQQGWESHWKELAENFAPRKSRFIYDRANNGSKLNQNIINSAPLRALRTQSSGMMAGLTSPSKPWFRLTTPDPEMMEYAPVREWLYSVENRMREMFAKTNLYNALPTLYQELGAFGTGCMAALESDKTVMRFEVMTAGSYYLANNEENEVDTMYRDRRMTVRQLVQKFGLENCSERVKSMYKTKNYEQWIDVVHCIEPNLDRKMGMRDNKNMPFSSNWYEKGSQFEGVDGFLLKSGFEEFPIMAPRWETTNEDVYGESPGMMALGDAKELQFEMKRKAKAIDKHVDPPMLADVSMKGKRASLIAGDITYVDPTKNASGFAGFQPAYAIKPELQALMLSIEALEDSIDEAFYVNLFLMLSMSDRRDMTATEVAERHEEKLLMLGPVMERLNSELLNKIIDRGFAIMSRRGMLPPPPDELIDVDLKVEYISILAQSMRMVGLSSIDRMVAFVGNNAQFDPQALDKVDFDQAADEYGSALGVPPGVLRSDDDVAAMREQRAQQQQAEQARVHAQESAETAKTLSETGSEDNNALQALTGL